MAKFTDKEIIKMIDNLLLSDPGVKINPNAISIALREKGFDLSHMTIRRYPAVMQHLADLKAEQGSTGTPPAYKKLDAGLLFEKEPCDEKRKEIIDIHEKETETYVGKLQKKANENLMIAKENHRLEKENRKLQKEIRDEKAECRKQRKLLSAAQTDKNALQKENNYLHKDDYVADIDDFAKKEQAVIKSREGKEDADDEE